MYNMLSNTTYIGHFIVEKANRGNGIGKKLWRFMTQRTQYKNLCLDAVDSLVQWYVQQGFVHRSYQMKSFTGVVSSQCRTNVGKQKYDIVPVANDTWSMVLAYDKRVYHGVDRERILRAWLSGSGIYSIVALSDKTVNGYGSFVNVADNEYSVRTVFGDNEDVVEHILENMLKHIPNGASLTFAWMTDKLLSERFRGFKLILDQQRLYTKFKIEPETDMMYIVCDHMV